MVNSPVSFFNSQDSETKTLRQQGLSSNVRQCNDLCVLRNTSESYNQKFRTEFVVEKYPTSQEMCFPGNDPGSVYEYFSTQDQTLESDTFGLNSCQNTFYWSYYLNSQSLFSYLKYRNNGADFMELSEGPNWVGYRYRLLFRPTYTSVFAFQLTSSFHFKCMCHLLSSSFREQSTV